MHGKWFFYGSSCRESGLSFKCLKCRWVVVEVVCSGRDLLWKGIVVEWFVEGAVSHQLEKKFVLEVLCRERGLCVDLLCRGIGLLWIWFVVKEVCHGFGLS